MNILVVLENNTETLHRLSLEAIVGSQKLGESVSVLLIGERAENIINQLKNYDLEKIITVKHELLASYNADGYSETVKQVALSISPNVITAGHTYQTRDYMPRVSAKLGAPFIPDVIAANGNGYTKQILNAKLNAEISTSSELFILSFQSATFSEDDLRPGSCEVESFPVELDSNIVRSVTEDPFQEEQGDVDLESADVLISVGRGIEKEENVPLAFELARKMGAEVSASRPIVDSGWIETFRQVGSSGSNVAPKLYFSLGISGAIQHVVGMKGSKKIMAINKDSDAPIFEIADYAIIGDVLEIVPKLIEALEQN
mgnify:FL=1